MFPMALSKKTVEKPGLAACIHQVIKITTRNKLSERYFLRLQLLDRWLILVSNQQSKLT